MKTQLMSVFILLSLLIPWQPVVSNSKTEETTTGLCAQTKTYQLHLPLIGKNLMPKNDILKQIDERLNDLPLSELDNTADPSETQPVPIPSGVSVKAVQDGILIEVDFHEDKAHTHPRFRWFNVLARPVNDDATDDSGHKVGWFSDSDFTWQPPYGGYTGWEIALTAESNTGIESDKTDWYQCIISTVYDDFSDYGGDEILDLDSLYWLTLEQFEDAGDWQLSPAANTTSGQYVEGKQGLKWTISGAFQDWKTVSLDLSNEARFTNDDYVAIFAYVENVAAIDFVQVCFATDTSNYYYISIAPSLSNGANFLKIKRSEFSEQGSPDWSNITLLLIRHANDPFVGTAYITFDDWRIVKADPDDADTFNDTGSAWDFSDGTWHIYPGKRAGEPTLDYSLGQIETPADDDYFATIQNVKMPHNKISAGIYLKGTNGRVGITFRVTDDTLGSEDALAAEIDTSNDTLYLVRYEGGAKSTLDSVDVSATPLRLNPAPNQTIWIGIDFRDANHERRIKIYVAASENYLFSAPSLQISHVTDAPWPDGNGVGLVAHACNFRAVEYRAGSPATADYAHKAGHALTAETAIEDYGAAVARRVALPATIGVWPMSSVQRSTGNVYDVSGQGRTLSYQGNPVFDFLSNGVPFIQLDGTGDYLSRTDETDLDVLGTESVIATVRRGFTELCWFWVDVDTGNEMSLMSKYNTTADNRSWHLLVHQNSLAIIGRVSSDGTTGGSHLCTGAVAIPGSWHFAAHRLIPSTSHDIFVDGVWTKNTTSVPASIFAGNADFMLGAVHGGTRLLDGRTGLSSLHFCAFEDEVIERIFQQERALFGVM
jgi:hypothetical protein